MGAGLMLAGCSAAPAEESVSVVPTVEATEAPTPTPEPTAEATEAPTPTATPLVLGDPEGTREVLFTNGTAGDIVLLQVKSSDAEDYEGNLLEADATASIVPSIPMGTQFVYRYAGAGADTTPEPGATVAADLEEAAPDAAAEELADGRAILFNETSDMHVAMSDGTDFVLYDLSFEDMKDASILYSTEDEVGYVEYTSVSTNEPVSTLEAQKALAQTGATATEAQDEGSGASSGSTTSSGGASSSSDESSSSGGSSSSNESSESSGSDESESSGGSSSGGSDESSSSGSSGSDSSGDGAPEPEPDGGGDFSQDAGDCIEDNVIWND